MEQRCTSSNFNIPPKEFVSRRCIIEASFLDKGDLGELKEDINIGKGPSPRLTLLLSLSPMPFQKASVCFIQLTSSLFGKSSRACAPRLSLRISALCMVTAALMSRFSSSSVSTRSVFHTRLRSATCGATRGGQG